MSVRSYKWEYARRIKITCPQCGKKRFVPYVDVRDHKTIATDEHGDAVFGRCDRQDHCGYYRYPSGVKRDENVQRVELPKPVPMEVSPSLVSVNEESGLFQFAAGIFGRERAIGAWKRYKVGATVCHRTVFWQIAIDGTVRAGKSIPYKADGHRDKNDRYPVSWVHTVPVYKEYITGNELRQCFFGEHLLTAYQSKPVAIVESEKTALFMSLFDPSYVWLAAGGAQGLKNREKNKVLQGRSVVLFPDNGQWFNWYRTAMEYGWRISDSCNEPKPFEGCDILDIYLECYKNEKRF